METKIIHDLAITRDYVRFRENIHKLKVAIELFGAENVKIMVDGKVNLEKDTNYIYQDNTALSEIIQPLQQKIYPRDRDEIFGHNYHYSETFKKHAGREFFVFDVDNDNFDKLWEKPRFFKSAGLQKQFEPFRYNGINKDIVESHIHSLLHANLFLVQDILDIRAETRFFVVNNKIVCGSYCNPDLFPDDINYKQFDARPSDKCGLNGYDAGLNILRMRAVAESFVLDLMMEDPTIANYVIDIGLLNDGSIVCIECNPLFKSGLYGTSWYYVLKELKEGLKCRAKQKKIS